MTLTDYSEFDLQTLIETARNSSPEGLAKFEASCRAAISGCRDTPAANHLLGLVKLKQGDGKGAVKLLQKAIKQDNHNLDIGADLATAQMRTGDQKSANALLTTILERDSNHFESLVAFGLLQHELGNSANAQVAFQKAAVLKPNDLLTNMRLANILLGIGNWSGASDVAIRCIEEIDSEAPEPWRILGEACIGLGDGPSAFDALREAVRRDESHIPTRCRVAHALIMSGHYSEAEDFMWKSVREYPEDPRIWVGLGIVLRERKDMDNALEAFEKAWHLDPENYQANAGMAICLIYQTRDEEAMDTLEAYRKRHPKDIRVLLDLSTQHQYAGRMKEAERLVKKVLASKPNHSFGLVHMVAIKKGKIESEHLHQLVENAKNPTLPWDDKVRSTFALGDALHAYRDYDNAFTAYSAANDLKWRSLKFDVNKRIGMQKKLLEAFPKNQIEDYRAKGCEDESPVFIVGMPRSGTTLTEQIIAAHPSAIGVGERFEVEGAFNRRNQMSSVEEQGRYYVDSIRKTAGDEALRIVDKMPTNFALCGYIASILPNAKIIHIRRHPLDTLLSNFRQNFGEGQEWSYNMEAMAQFFSAYQHTMENWKNEMPKGVLLEVDYEELIDDLTGVGTSMLNHIGLEWDDRCANFHEHASLIRTASLNQARSPLYKSSVGGWRKYEQHLQPLVAAIRGFGGMLPNDVDIC